LKVLEKSLNLILTNGQEPWANVIGHVYDDDDDDDDDGHNDEYSSSPICISIITGQLAVSQLHSQHNSSLIFISCYFSAYIFYYSLLMLVKSVSQSRVTLKANARFYQLGINLGIANPRSEDNPRFILGLSFGVLSTFSNLGITNLGITRLSL